ANLEEIPFNKDDDIDYLKSHIQKYISNISINTLKKMQISELVKYLELKFDKNLKEYKPFIKEFAQNIIQTSQVPVSASISVNSSVSNKSSNILSDPSSVASDVASRV